MFFPANLGKSCSQCISVHWYCWRYQGPALLSCSVARGFLPFGIWIFGSAEMLFWHQSKGWSAVSLLATSQTLNGSFFIHSVSKAKLCVCLPGLLAWASLTKDSFNTEPMWSLVMDRATAMIHLPKMLFCSPLKAKIKGLQGIFDSGVQFFECTPCLGL